MATKNNTKSDSSEEHILEIARKRFDEASEAEADVRREAVDDLKFRAGEQWPDDVKRAREIDKRPCLTINRLPQFIRQITNDQRQNRPAVKVSPVDDTADIKTAKIYQGLIRHIEYSSNADVAYDTAFEGATIKGLGYWRIVTEYCDPMSFDQILKVKRVRNSFSVYLDPNSQEPDGSDANWGFVFEEMSEDDFKAQYPNSKMASMDDWSSIGDNKRGWATASTCRVAEYLYKEYRNAALCLLSNHQVVEKSKLPDVLPEGLTIVSERNSLIPQIKWCKINGIEILEKTDWPGRWIPIVPVLGDELDVDGERILEGVIRHAKDPQRMYNYWASSETETIALAPRAPFIGVEGQFEGHENQWKTANVQNHAFLQYKAKTIGGTLVGPPTRNVFEPPVQAISQARMIAADDLKATTGIYDSALGAQSNEKSGIAIQRRKQQTQVSNFHLIDNLSRSLRHSGRILVDMIPHVYDTPRAARIIGEDGQEEIVPLNQIFQKNGEEHNYDLSAGTYDVTISAGPSFETKREEAVQSMMDLTRAYPKMAEVAGDLMVKNMDWPGAEEIAERLRKTLPPGMVVDKDKKPMDPAAQQQMVKMNQMIDELTKHLNDAHDMLDKKKIEIESRERIEFAKMDVDMKKALLLISTEEAQLAFKQEIANINQRLSLLNIDKPIGDEMEMSEGAGPDQASAPLPIDQPTGGISPGQPMGV